MPGGAGAGAAAQGTPPAWRLGLAVPGVSVPAGDALPLWLATAAALAVHEAGALPQGFTLSDHTVCPVSESSAARRLACAWCLGSHAATFSGAAQGFHAYLCTLPPRALQVGHAAAAAVEGVLQQTLKRCRLGTFQVIHAAAAGSGRHAAAKSESMPSGAWQVGHAAAAAAEGVPLHHAAAFLALLLQYLTLALWDLAGRACSGGGGGGRPAAPCGRIPGAAAAGRMGGAGGGRALCPGAPPPAPGASPCHRRHPCLISLVPVPSCTQYLKMWRASPLSCTACQLRVPHPATGDIRA